MSPKWLECFVRNIKINYTARTNQCKSYYKKASEIQHHLLIRDQWSCIHPWLHHFPNGKDSTASYSVQAVCKFFFHLSSWSKLWKHWWICLSKTKDSVKGFRRCTQLPRLFSSTSTPKTAIMKTLVSLLKTLTSTIKSNTGNYTHPNITLPFVGPVCPFPVTLLKCKVSFTKYPVVELPSP